jgi:acetyl-CoA acyltransferase 1
VTSENVARDFGIDRKAQDEFAALSFQRAALAQKEGRFKDEIVPVRTFIKTTKNSKDSNSSKEDDEGQMKPITISQDDGIRDGVTFESLSKIRPAFANDGSTTAGNASQISDGAAAVLLMRRRTAKRLGMPIIGKYITSVVRGVSPRVMGIVCIFAIVIVVAFERCSLDTFFPSFNNEQNYSQNVVSIGPSGSNPSSLQESGDRDQGCRPV